MVLEGLAALLDALDTAFPVPAGEGGVVTALRGEEIRLERDRAAHNERVVLNEFARDLEHVFGIVERKDLKAFIVKMLGYFGFAA